MKLNNQLYAVVDIETTGGKPADTKIMEIAICISDGVQILEQYSTLINPQRPIDYYVKKLTGITDEMVINSPEFHEKAEEIAALLEGKIFVAHNVDFDYNIVKREFLEIGKPFESQKLCTVKSSRKVFHGLSSYSLGNITAHLEIELTNAHRALDDTIATAHLLHKILEKSDLSFLQEEIKNQNYIVELPEGWTIKNNEVIEPKSGIIYYHGEEGEIIYIESSSNVQKLLYTFINKEMHKDALAKRVAEHTRTITLDYVVDNFKAEVKMLNDIQSLKPRYNKIMKPHSDNFVVHLKQDEHAMYFLNIVKKANLKDEIEGPMILSNSFRNGEKIKQKIIYSQDLAQLPVMKKQILKVTEELKHILVKEYNDLLKTKIFKEYSCPFGEGYYVFNINAENEVEAISVKDYYIHSWGYGRLEGNEILDFKSEFEFDSNQKITRKFLNILPKTSYKIFQKT